MHYNKLTRASLIYFILTIKKGLPQNKQHWTLFNAGECKIGFNLAHLAHLFINGNELIRLLVCCSSTNLFL